MSESSKQNKLRDPWLIAMWPGLGSVGMLAGTYLVDQLGAGLATTIPEQDFFDIDKVTVKDGIARAGRLPRSMLFEWQDPADRRDLIIFIGEAQPSERGYAMCRSIMDYASARGVERVMTFAAMATQLHPRSEPRVFGVATSKTGLDSLDPYGLEVLQDGQIGGLNGAMLAAAYERGVDGVCMLGEIPFFAGGLPNPKASQVILEKLSLMTGIHVDLAMMARQAEAMEPRQVDLLEQLKARAEHQQNDEGLELLDLAEANDDDDGPDAEVDPLDPETRRQIEALFERASEDRSNAVELKSELDRLGVFEMYENRFLDLFRKAG